METPLVISAAVSAIATVFVALFTWRLYVATEKMGETQAKQTEILERQANLLEGQTKLQEELSEIQERLARADGTPLLYLRRNVSAGTAVELKNLGKYGAEVVEIRRHVSRPEAPARGGERLRFEEATALPAGIAPQEPPCVVRLGSSMSNVFTGPAWFEVLYRHGVGGELLSDLWEIPEGGHAFHRVPGWHARRVPEAEA